MSWQAIAWTYQQTQTSTTSQTLVLLYLAGRHNIDSDECFVSISTMERDLNMPRRSVTRVLAELQMAGLIGKRDGNRKCNTYTVHWTHVEATHERAKSGTNGNSARDTTSLPQGHHVPSARDTTSLPSESPVESCSNHQGETRAQGVPPDKAGEDQRAAMDNMPPLGTLKKAVLWSEAWTFCPNSWETYARRHSLDPAQTWVAFSEWYLSSEKKWRNWRCVWQRWCREQVDRNRSKALKSIERRAYSGTLGTVNGVNLDMSKAHVGESMEAFQRRMAAEQSRGEPESELQKQIWGR